jgi:hypothetical protein
MKRYKVCIKNAKECRTELTFPDLCVKYTNGFSPALKIKEGQEIPLDVCESEDIRKSWLVGSLKGYLDNKWIEEIIETAPLNQPEELRLSNFITEQMMANPAMIQPLKPLEAIKQEVKEETPATPILPEIQVAETIKVSAPKIEPITDLALVKTFEDFERLSQFLKLRFIKDSDNFELLRKIQSLTPSVQLQNNITLRLNILK